MENLEKLLRKETNYMFADIFYLNLSNKILDFVSDKKHKEGYIYFIKNGLYGSKVKIGCAIDIDKRVNSYQTAFHEKIYILGYIKSQDYIFLEKEVHSFFSEKRLKGEWFQLDDFDIFNLKEVFDFIPINDFYNNKILIKNMISKESQSKFTEIIEFCKSLELGKYYNTGNLFNKFKSLYPDCIISNASWFGREMNRSFGILGINKKSYTKNGIRTFILN